MVGERSTSRGLCWRPPPPAVSHSHPGCGKRWPWPGRTACRRGAGVPHAGLPGRHLDEHPVAPPSPYPNRRAARPGLRHRPPHVGGPRGPGFLFYTPPDTSVPPPMSNKHLCLINKGCADHVVCHLLSQRKHAYYNPRPMNIPRSDWLDCHFFLFIGPGGEVISANNPLTPQKW